MTTIYHHPMPVKFRRFKLHTHLISDSHEELMRVALAAGMRPDWLQNPGRWDEHFDIFDGRIDRLEAAGAMLVDRSEWVAMYRANRAKSRLATASAEGVG